MKVALQYTPEDLRKLVADDATARGYAVLPTDVDLPDDVVALVQFEGTPTLPAPKPAPQAAPQPGQPAPQTAAARGLTHAPPPTQEGAWTSQPARGGDPRYEPIEPPTFQERVPRVREIGKDTGLVRRLTGTPDGRPRGWVSPSPDGAPEAPAEDGEEGVGEFGAPADFLDDYLQPQARH